MDRAVRWLLVIVVLAAAAWAVLRWPHLDTVETGRTPEYPELQPRDYSASEAQVSRAVRAALNALGWQFVGGGRGPGGSEVQARARGTLPLESEVSIRIQRVGGRTRVIVRSRSPNLPWDLGENARVIEKFLAALDAQMTAR
ncbi:MAG: hypothetical protein DMF78_11080 [Acidobacteria bacterium]|nr:MAG: hypothetical protein DMF78_11080 [Acidobacteriota bacterium]